MINCYDWEDFKSNRERDVEAGMGHYKCGKCGSIDSHHMDRCLMHEQAYGLTPRNPNHRVWLYENSKDNQSNATIRKAQRNVTDETCFICHEIGHKKIDCPQRNDKKKSAWGANSSSSGYWTKGNASNRSKSKDDIQCYNCKEWGHHARDCPNEEWRGASAAMS